MELVEYSKKVDEMVQDRFPGSQYYSLTKLLSQKDINNNEPTAYISTSNRTAGKTSSLCLLNYVLHIESDKKFLYLLRNGSEIGGYASVFNDICSLYNLHECKSKLLVKDTIAAIEMDGKEIAYVLSLKKADSIKKYSPLFSDVEVIVNDEYQLETKTYLRDEVGKLRSIYRSVARGGGKQVRDVKMILTGNPVTLMNPYLIGFHITEHYRKGKRFIKNKRVVAEFVINESARTQMESSPSSELFEDDIAYDCGVEFLINDATYLEKCSGKSRYLFTICYENQYFGVRQYINQGIIHVGRKPDPNCQTILAFKENDRVGNMLLIDRNDFIWAYVRQAYINAGLRFDDINSKTIIFEMLGIDLYK